ncbi:MAG: transcription antitermination factor NusB [Pseudomonadota bacterium]
MTNKTNVWARRKSRRALVQAVYQWQLAADSYSRIAEDFHAGEALNKADKAFFTEILQHVIHHADELDQHFAPLLDRQIEQLDHVERAILRLATVEFSSRIDVPYKVVIDEYVELAKTFGAQDSHKYINGVLDKLASNLRELETR